MMRRFDFTTALSPCNKAAISAAWASNSLFKMGKQASWAADADTCVASCPKSKGFVEATPFANPPKDASCTTCTDKTFSAADDKNSCKVWTTRTCAKGRGFVTGTSSTDTVCADCVGQTFSPVDDTSGCITWSITNCGPGFGFKTGSSSTDSSCTACTSEAFSSTTNRDACELWSIASCPPGSGYLPGSSTVDASCSPCSGGMYSAASDKTVCVAHSTPSCTNPPSPVIPGNTTTDATCANACAPGSFSMGGVPFCRPHSQTKCAPGFGYKAGTAFSDSSCTACVGNETFSKDDDTGPCLAHSLSTCTLGYGLVAGSSVADSACPACKDGTYSSASDAGNCSTCAAGYYAGAGASLCTPCAAGTFQAFEGKGSCGPCAAGEYAVGENNTACTVGSGSGIDGGGGSTGKGTGGGTKGRPTLSAAQCWVDVLRSAGMDAAGGRTMLSARIGGSLFYQGADGDDGGSTGSASGRTSSDADDSLNGAGDRSGGPLKYLDGAFFLNVRGGDDIVLIMSTEGPCADFNASLVTVMLGGMPAYVSNIEPTIYAENARLRGGVTVPPAGTGAHATSRTGGTTSGDVEVGGNSSGNRTGAAGQGRRELRVPTSSPRSKRGQASRRLLATSYPAKVASNRSTHVAMTVRLPSFAAVCGNGGLACASIRGADGTVALQVAETNVWTWACPPECPGAAQAASKRATWEVILVSERCGDAVGYSADSPSAALRGPRAPPTAPATTASAASTAANNMTTTTDVEGGEKQQCCRSKRGVSSTAAASSSPPASPVCHAFTTDPRICLNPRRAHEEGCAFGGGGDCRPCSTHAACPGGYRTWPEAGYWVRCER